MQVSVETTSGLERRLIVGVPGARVDDAVNAKLQEARRNVRLDGFRPGKVPMKVLKQRFGESVRMEVLGDVINQSFRDAVEQQQLHPVGQPNIEPKSIDEGKDIEFIATFEVLPDIELRDCSGIEVEQLTVEITESDVDAMIEKLREQNQSWEPVERAAAEGDQVKIDYVGTRDGEAFEGGSAEDSDLELGSGRMIPGFEDGIVGMSAGEEKVLQLTFPEEYHAEDLRGAAVEFKITLKSVNEKQLPELDESLFEKFGVKEGGVDAFRAEVRSNMERERDNRVENRRKTQVLDAVLERHSEQMIPQALVAQEIEALRNQSMQQFGGLGNNPDFDLKSILPDDMFSEQAERRVRLGLLLNEMITRDDIKADADKVREAIEDMAAGYEDKEGFVNWVYSNQQQLQSIESMVVENAVVDKLIAEANVSDVKLSYDELMAPPAEEAADGEEQDG